MLVQLSLVATLRGEWVLVTVCTNKGLRTLTHRQKCILGEANVALHDDDNKVVLGQHELNDGVEVGINK